MTASASTVGLPEDKAYLNHHFNCPYCISAGTTPGKQERCPEGQQLWQAYRLATTPQEHKQTRKRLYK